MGGTHGGADDAGALQLLPATSSRSRCVSFVLRRAHVAIIDGERQERPIGVVEPAERRVGDDVEALLAAVVGMRPPGDVGDQAGGMAQPPFVGALLWSRCDKNLVGPVAQLAGMFGRARAQPRPVLAEGQQRIAPLFGIRQQRVEQPLADAEHREHDLARLCPLDQFLRAPAHQAESLRAASW